MGMAQEIRDKGGRLLGHIDDKGYRKEARNVGGKLLGWFEDGKTRDSAGNFLYNGDTTVSLILNEGR
jgi:hypothetical protein